MKALTAICAVAALASGASACAADHSASANSGEITFSISLAKDKYAEAEPVIATLTVANGATVSRRLGEADTGYTVSCIVRQVRGVKPLPGQIVSTVMGPPPDYGWVFQAGEARSTQTDLQADFVTYLPVGDYTVRAMYWGLADVKDIWHGKIETPELAFSVVPADPARAEAAQDFGEFSRKAGASKSFAQASIAPLENLKDPSRGGEFAKYAGFWLACARQSTEGRDGFIAGLREYVAEHSDVPFYGRRAILALGMALYAKAEYAEARRAFEKLPDGYWRMDWLRKCDAKLAGQ